MKRILMALALCSVIGCAAEIEHADEPTDSSAAEGAGGTAAAADVEGTRQALNAALAAGTVLTPLPIYFDNYTQYSARGARVHAADPHE